MHNAASEEQKSSKRCEKLQETAEILIILYVLLKESNTE